MFLGAGPGCAQGPWDTGDRPGPHICKARKCSAATLDPKPSLYLYLYFWFWNHTQQILGLIHSEGPGVPGIKPACRTAALQALSPASTAHFPRIPGALWFTPPGSLPHLCTCAWVSGGLEAPQTLSSVLALCSRASHPELLHLCVFQFLIYKPESLPPPPAGEKREEK